MTPDPGTLLAPAGDDVPATCRAYELTAERIAELTGLGPASVPAAEATITGLLAQPAAADPGEIRAQLRREIAAGRYATPIILAPGGMTAGTFRGGILVDAGPDVYQALAAKWMAQAMDALADGDEDLAQELLADVRTAVTLADTATGGAS